MDKIWAWLSENVAVVVGGGFAFLISMISHREGKFMDRVSSSLLCSLFSTGLYYGIVSLFPAVPSVAAVAIGSFVGFYGVDECKRLILDKIKIAVGKNSKEKDNEHDSE